MAKIKKSGVDMTQGSPLKLIFFFALPLLAGNVLQQLYNMVDSIVVGNWVGDAALAAVGTAFPVVFLIVSLFMGIGLGATVMLSQYYGAKDNESVRKTIATIYTAMMVGAIPLTIIGLLVAGPVLRMMGVQGEMYPLALRYAMIIFAGSAATLGYNVNSGIMRGLGDSKTPLVFLAIASAINIVLDLLFVIVFGWGVAGVAIATVIAQFVSWVFGVFYINKHYPEFEIKIFKFEFHKDLFKQALQIGIPSGLQQMLFSVGVMVLQALINKYDTSFIAGFQGANKLDTFGFMPVQSFAAAITTYVGQNIGAGRMDRVKKGMWVTMFMSCTVNVVVAILFIPLGPICMRLFTQDPAVIAAGCAYLDRIMPFYFLFSLMFILNSVMRGAGESIVPMVTTLVALWVVRLPAAYYLAANYGRDNIFYCYAIGWAVGLVLALAYYLTGRWKNKALVHNLVLEAE